MSAYLLTCACGKTVPVELGQAGSRVSCTCGQSLEVPTLRNLRLLPQATEENAQKSKSSSWGVRQGIVTICVIAAAILLGWSAWSWWSQPKRPVFVAADYMAQVDQNLPQWTPKMGWQMWISHYRPLAERGLQMFQAANAAQIEYQIASAQFLRGMLLSLAGVFAIIAAAVRFWPEQRQTRR